MMSKRLGLASVLILGAMAAAAWGGLRAIAARHFRTTLVQAKEEIAAGQYGRARKRLSALDPRFDTAGEVDYQLGICELYRGHADLALAAWDRVPPDGPFGARARLQCAMLAMSAGQLTRAEETLEAALARGHRSDAPVLLRGLQLLYHVEGRTEDVRRAIIASWPDSDTPAELLKQLSRLDAAPLPLEATRKTLDTAAPDDDRAWLGRANLAIRTGQFDRAAAWLDACQKRRPRDLAVWRSRLDLARASGDLAGAWSALENLPADLVAPSDLLRVRGWLASRTGDVAAERSALTALVELEPGDTTALDRLAVLAGAAGDAAEVNRLRARKSAMMAALTQYRALLKGDAVGDPAELARLAKVLGRQVENRGWSLIRDHEVGEPGPSRPALAPTDPVLTSGETSSAGATLADRCADLRLRSLAPAPEGQPGVAPRFVDGAETAGLRFVQDNGQTALKRLPETMSGGVGLLDVDGDGWLDVYAVQGGPFPPGEGQPAGDRLYRNRGDGTFEDVTQRAGLAKLMSGYGHGVAVGDFDNDGRPDLFVTRWRSYSLLRNRGDGTFEDMTARANLAGDRDWPTSAAWADLDADGDLDLYVCHYLNFDMTSASVCVDAKARVNHYCSPRNFAALPDHVFRNDGGRFIEVTAAAGFVDPDGRGLGVVAADLNDDNRIDVYVANDMSANYLFQNRGGLHFEEVAFPAGSAANSSGGFQSGMGIACGDFDGDGRPDLAVTNYYGESTTLFHNLGGGLFADLTAASGLAAPTRQLLGFGIAFLDANNDGRLDLISANGHVSDYEPVFPWKMPIQLLTGGAGGRLADLSASHGGPFAPLHLGRGLATGDLDNDGRIDAVVIAQNDPLVYVHNQTDKGGHFVTLRLEGVRSNRDGVGARVTLEAGSLRLSQQRFGGGSYQSSGDPRLHFGLGDRANRVRLEVRWPSGQIDRHDGLDVDRGYQLREGARQAEPLPGWNRPRG
jgi:tetratricopeptide (TPR) repeat protein